jgi:hypothetical protein
MVYGVLAARRRDLVAHAHAMRHVVAQMSVAIFSRAMIVGFDMLEFDPDVAYVISLWVPVLLTAAVAEGISRRFTFSWPNPFHALQRSYNVPKPLAAVVRARSHAHSLVRSR